MKKIIYAILFLLSYFSVASAQPVLDWTNSYNGTGNFTDNFYKSVIDNSGNVYSIGRTWVPPGNYDILLIKYDSSGNQQWVKTYGDPDSLDDVGNCITLDDSGNVYVGGAINLPSLNTDGIVIKFNSNGVQQWKWQFNGAANNIDIVNDMHYYNETIIVTGQTYNLSFAGKINATTGSTVWVTNSIDYGVSTQGIKVGVDTAGNIYSALHGGKYRVIKFNSTGTIQWSSEYYGGAAGDEIYDMVISPDGNVYVTGISGSNGGPTTGDIATVKFATTGDTSWVRRIASTSGGEDFGVALRLDNSGNLYVLGRYDTLISQYADVLLIKYQTSGALVWQKNLFQDLGIPEMLR